MKKTLARRSRPCGRALLARAPRRRRARPRRSRSTRAARRCSSSRSWIGSRGRQGSSSTSATRPRPRSRPRSWRRARNSPADVYWSQEPGTLGLVGARGLLARLPQATVGKVPSRFSTREPALGRHQRALACPRLQHERAAAERSPGFGLGPDEPRWKGKIGIAPTNASFQAFLGATIHLYGEARVRAWLEGSRRTTCASTRTTRPWCRPSAGVTSRSGS